MRKNIGLLKAVDNASFYWEAFRRASLGTPTKEYGESLIVSGNKSDCP